MRETFKEHHQCLSEESRLSMSDGDFSEVENEQSKNDHKVKQI